MSQLDNSEEVGVQLAAGGVDALRHLALHVDYVGVYPSTASRALASLTFFVSRPMTATISASYSTSSLASAGITMGSPWAMSALLAR